MMLNNYFADMHIHIGRDIYNKPVKITASKNLTMTNVLKEASRRKGMDLIGVIDCQSPAVQEELIQLIQQGEAEELQDGGIRFEDVTLLLGSEIEIYDDNCHGPIHALCFFPTLAHMHQFSKWLSKRMKNITLSSQRYYGTAKDLQEKVKELDGLFIPAHIFTPFKSLYGKGVKHSLLEVFDPDLIDAVELGLSSDTEMADQIAELHQFTFLTNSDSHSLGKIGREYQQITMATPSFNEFHAALKNDGGRRVLANYGMNPKLGKYYTTVCQQCFAPVTFQSSSCPHCQGTKIINGVFDRINQLASESGSSRERPPYLYQVPLDYLPGLGPKTFEKLLNFFSTEMNIIHYVPDEKLREVLPDKLTEIILAMRKGQLQVEAGGGGKYGHVKTK